MIVVFGSINVDIVVSVPALPGPGETVKGDGYQIFPGGKGANQALAARRAGDAVAMVGAVGNDGFAAIALSLLKADGVALTGVTGTSSPTGIATITVDHRGESWPFLVFAATLARAQLQRVVREARARQTLHGIGSPMPR